MILAALLILGGCSGLKSDPWEGIPAEELAKKGLDQYNHGKYYQAVETFSAIKERFPFSRFSLLAELKSADSKFYMEDYPEALGLYSAFEESHPTNEAIPYVVFQIGRCYFRTVSTVDRDTSGASEAIKVFNRLLRSFPASPYTAEAKVLIQKAKTFLAEYELRVADFYMRTNEYEQARGRAEYVIAGFPDLPVAVKAKEMISKIADMEQQRGK